MTSRFVTGNLFLVISVISATLSQVLLKHLLDEVRPEGLGWSAIQPFLAAEKLLQTIAVGLLLVIGYLFWVLALAKLDLSYAYPIASMSVLVAAFFSVLFLGEVMNARMWVGTVLITAGLVLLAPGH